MRLWTLGAFQAGKRRITFYKQYLHFINNIYTFALRMTRASSRNVGKFYRTVKLSTKNLRFIQYLHCNHTNHVCWQLQSCIFLYTGNYFHPQLRDVRYCLHVSTGTLGFPSNYLTNVYICIHTLLYCPSHTIQCTYVPICTYTCVTIIHPIQVYVPLGYWDCIYVPLYACVHPDHWDHNGMCL